MRFRNVPAGTNLKQHLIRVGVPVGGAALVNHLYEFMERFATALDNDDYITIALCLEPDAIYHNGNGTIVGRDKILASLRRACEWGHRNLDSLRFTHDIVEEEPLQIRLIDVLEYGGERFMLDHTMLVSLSARDRIEALRLLHPVGERERLRAFFQRHGFEEER